MGNSYRIKTDIGIDKTLQVCLDQEFDFLEILSLKILPSEIYLRDCADYGVVVGRVSVNNGFGIPNARVSVFVPITTQDLDNPNITSIYPYQTVEEINSDGYKYNLLPKVKSYNAHTPTGTFPTREEVLKIPTYIEVYDKYYKYTVKTNDSGDFMIFGVPLGTQTLVMNVDLSDIGQFSLTPQDLIRMGRATEDQVDGTKFKSSTNLDELPQIVRMVKTVEVQPLWGQQETCNIGINRSDFDLGAEGIKIEPTAVFMGSMFSDLESNYLKSSCKPNKLSGELCSLTTGPGQILSIRQTIDTDVNNRPILEQFTLGRGGKVIDENGTWLVELPMNLDYVYTNEYGEQVLSLDPSKGIPTKGKYRFKVKWNQSPSSSEPIKRGYVLVPNIKEWGWNGTSDPNSSSPITPPFKEFQSSYAFSLDWNDYGNTGTTIGNQMINEAINCKDRFYEFQYNKVYTVSQLITQFRKGDVSSNIISVKNILDQTCDSDNNKFPTNDSYYRFDFLFFTYRILMFLAKLLIVPLVIVTHVVTSIIRYVFIPFLVLLGIFAGFMFYQVVLQAIAAYPSIGQIQPLLQQGLLWLGLLGVTVILIVFSKKIIKLFKHIRLSNITYPSCEYCECDDPDDMDVSDVQTPDTLNNSSTTNNPPTNTDGSSCLSPLFNQGNYSTGSNWYGEMLAGMLPPPTGPVYSNYSTVSVAQNVSTNGNYYISFSLSVPERMNLFNSKGKFYNNLPGSFITNGFGPNQIKARFGYDLNGGAFPNNLNTSPTIGKYHYDNVVAVVVTPECYAKMTAGKVISFQDTNKSSDQNYKNQPQNIYGTESITGTPYLQSATTKNITVQSADPANPSTTYNVTYSLTGNTDNDLGLYAKFPMDVEYFQVVTGYTISDFMAAVPTNADSNSLFRRFIDSYNVIYDIDTTNNYSYTTISPNGFYSFTNYKTQYIVFLVRGVDPNSPRVKCSYDLSILFGHNNYGNVIVNGDYKMNIPLRAGLRCVDHDYIGNNNSTDGYAGASNSGDYLFFNSFHFLPSPTDFVPFTTTLPKYYMDTSESKNQNSSYAGVTVISGSHGASIAGTVNYYAYENTSSTGTFSTVPTTQNVGTLNRGYFVGELVEGTSYMTMTNIKLNGSKKTPTVTSSYYNSLSYVNSHAIVASTSFSSNRIVMRSDRLPFSTSVSNSSTPSRPLHTNSAFSVYIIDDAGLSTSNPVVINTTPQSLTSAETVYNGPNSGLLNSFECGELIPLSCYQNLNGTIVTAPNGDSCYQTSLDGGVFDGTFLEGKFTLKKYKRMPDKKCYEIVQIPFVTFVADLNTVNEWLGRNVINYAACRNVLSHIFTNNWINGTLYMPVFKNNRFFDSQNKPYSVYCNDVVVKHEATETFYYRSSPYEYQVGFIGQPSPISSTGSYYGGNVKNLMYPTTLIDLGPKTDYLDEIVFSKDFNGYVVDRLESTTYHDVSELLNLFFISRITNLDFISNMITGPRVQNFFSRHQNSSGGRLLMIDGDYAQLISINSELGVVPFENEQYPNPNQVYYNNGTIKDGVIGVFFESDLQVRDFITPKRTIINPNALTSLNNPSCVFDNFAVNSQEVPYYLWNITYNSAGPSIFGSQQNDWYTNVVSTTFLTSKYQSMDRTSSSSYYPVPFDMGRYSNFKGYIYNVKSNVINPNLPYGTTSAAGTNNQYYFRTGNPFFFYFGLKKGRSAFDRFSQLYIQTDTTTP